MSDESDVSTTTEAPKLEHLKKVRTGVPGLDSVLWGGLPAGRTTLLTGGSGSGKSVFGLQFTYSGAVAGIPGVLVSFEERAESIRENARTFGWDLAAEEDAGRLAIMELRPNPEAVLSGRFSLHNLLGQILEVVLRIGAERIVLDGADALLRLFDDVVRERTELYSLHEWLVDHQLTTVLTAKLTASQYPSARYEFLDFMADCVIHIRQDVKDKAAARLLRVVKCRGSGFGRYEYPCVITQDGFRLAPITSVALRHRPLGSRMSSGHKALDEILAGGFRRGAAILVFGPSGTGKTTFSSTFAKAATARDERVLYVSFEQSEAEFLDAMLSPGIDLRPAVRDGHLRYLGAMPEAMGAEEHLHRILQVIEEWFPHHVILDPISALHRLGSSKLAFAFVVRLIDACKQRGITCFLTTQRSGRLDDAPDDHASLSSLVDTKIFLRYLECGCMVHRGLLIAKSVGSSHSNRLHGYAISDHGLEIQNTVACAQIGGHCEPRTPMQSTKMPQDHTSVPPTLES